MGDFQDAFSDSYSARLGDRDDLGPLIISATETRQAQFILPLSQSKAYWPQATRPALWPAPPQPTRPGTKEPSSSELHPCKLSRRASLGVWGPPGSRHQAMPLQGLLPRNAAVLRGDQAETRPSSAADRLSRAQGRRPLPLLAPEGCGAGLHWAQGAEARAAWTDAGGPAKRAHMPGRSAPAEPGNSSDFLSNLGG